jgi:hypothetical protein
MQFDRTLVLERLAQLPERVQRFTRSDEFCLALADLLERYGLQGEVLSGCRNHITYVITGLATKIDLHTHLTRDAKLAEPEARRFIEEAERLLFNPIRTLLVETLPEASKQHGALPPANTVGVDPYHEPVG